MSKSKIEFGVMKANIGQVPVKLVEKFDVMFRGELYTVPAGFETDGASIPRWLWPVCGHPLEAPRVVAAIVHDFLYGGGDPEATRADADDLYRDMQIELGIPRCRAYIEWLALRLCGWTHWKTETKGKKMEKLMFQMSAAVLSFSLVGCGKSVDVEGRGMYANANSATVGIGDFEVVTYPEGVEGARIKYEEDTPWLSPGQKTHAFKIDIVGTNACSQVSGIVSNICAAFISSAPKIAAINNGIIPTNSVSSAAK